MLDITLFLSTQMRETLALTLVVISLTSVIANIYTTEFYLTSPPSQDVEVVRQAVFDALHVIGSAVSHLDNITITAQ